MLYWCVFNIEHETETNKKKLFFFSSCVVINIHGMLVFQAERISSSREAMHAATCSAQLRTKAKAAARQAANVPPRGDFCLTCTVRRGTCTHKYKLKHKQGTLLGKSTVILFTEANPAALDLQPSGKQAIG